MSRTYGFSTVSNPSSARSVAKPPDEVVEIGHVRHHVVGDDDVSRAVLVADRPGRVDTEESDDRRHPDRLAPPRRVRAPGRSRACGCRPRRSSARGSRRCSRPRPPTTPCSRPREAMTPSTYVGRVSAHRVGERREVRVLLVEDPVGRQCVAELHERAFGAERDRQRERLVRVRGGRRVDEFVGDRRVAERQDRMEFSGAAGSAGGHRVRVARHAADHGTSSALPTTDSWCNPEHPDFGPQ